MTSISSLGPMGQTNMLMMFSDAFKDAGKEHNPIRTERVHRWYEWFCRQLGFDFKTPPDDHIEDMRRAFDGTPLFIFSDPVDEDDEDPWDKHPVPLDDYLLLFLCGFQEEDAHFFVHEIGGLSIEAPFLPHVDEKWQRNDWSAKTRDSDGGPSDWSPLTFGHQSAADLITAIYKELPEAHPDDLSMEKIRKELQPFINQ